MRNLTKLTATEAKASMSIFDLSDRELFEADEWQRRNSGYDEEYVPLENISDEWD